ncbi:MAG: MEKHLA domain-containing protein [Methylotetracoccus sp.]
MDHYARPSEENEFLAGHIALLRASYHHWTGRDLVEPRMSARDAARFVFGARFALLSHDGGKDPVFNYGNEVALGLFGLDWDEFTSLPSRLSAEPELREERARLLEEVSANGFIDDYRGVRIARGGQRFRIEQASVWNLTDPTGVCHGQAAMFRHWTFLDDRSDQD